MAELIIEKEKALLHTDFKEWFDVVKKYTLKDPSELSEQFTLLKNFRQDIYEELNQLQHKALIITVAEILHTEYPKINKWNWHPKQTSHPKEADLTGYSDSKVTINAEVTTSMKPVGTIDTRMRKTLKSLSTKDGKRFYFVQTMEMFNRAKRKIDKNGWNIIPRQI